ncbi:MAG: elongation factor Ts [Saprospiraceae bacterium]|nr:elongation factor Ts [Saprospiraceae bacterium]MBK6565266.1 elongation factor Ts [Saprospiraceae bacterium]MBK7525941.1 elongation factor Ts [Saprospiraceae bacterium]MBK8371084.1 elongation factor Ts [Saprospiraceae bacterium]MBK8546015.1 elongation factor Ts [Saprospiraceae bacterium]
MSEFTISASAVKDLRDITGAGMMDCKNALTEASGDFDKAIELLRLRGQKMSEKRADRDAKEGVVIALVNDGQNKGIIVRLSCETDFVAKNDDFINLTKEIAQLVLNHFPQTREELYALELNGVRIDNVMAEQVAKIGEKIEVSDYQFLTAPLVTSYIHMGYKAGVLVGLNKDDKAYVEAGRDVAMQVAAMKPVALDKDDVSQDIIAKEIEIGKEIARQEGKAEDMLEKIALGKLNKFFKESTLLNQVFVKDGKISVAEYLKSKNPELTATAFRHVKLG